MSNKYYVCKNAIDAVLKAMLPETTPVMMLEALRRAYTSDPSKFGVSAEKFDELSFRRCFANREFDSPKELIEPQQELARPKVEARPLWKWERKYS